MAYPITGLVLAGGASRRMGRPKATLDVGGKTLTGRVIDSIRPLCDEIIIVARHIDGFLPYGLKTVRDLVPGQGPLGGLATGLFYAAHPWVLTVACDLPFLNPGILKLLADTAMVTAMGAKALVPKTTDGWQPLVAVYNRDCLGICQKALKQGHRKVDDLKHQGVGWIDLPESELRAIDPGLVSFMNLNTPDELERARRLAEGREDGIF